MKVFFSTLSAILVAALIIWAVATAYSLREQDAHTRQIILKGELQRMSDEWAEQASKDPQFDPRMEKLQARRREIEEASEAGKPIPPNPWQSRGQP
jgi:hypothetical protein